MVFKSVICMSFTCLAVVSFNLHAAIVSADWQTPGDTLITQDTVNGLEWLDLTETNGMSYNELFAQLSAGGIFEGWRYATNYEVIALWSEFGIDLWETKNVIGEVDNGIVEASNYLGNILNEYNPVLYSYGVLGITGEKTHAGSISHLRFGALYVDGDMLNVYEGLSINFPQPDDSSAVYLGSYLTRDITTVPIPTAISLFGSGLIGLIGVARRKTHA